MTVVRRVSMCLALLLAPSLTLPAIAGAQGPDVRGVLRDSASGDPIPGAVVLVMDAAGRIVNRTISSARGQYRVLRPATAVQLRAVRLGFRPRTVPLPSPRAESTVIDLTLATVARTLEAMNVVAARGCPVRADRAEAFGLLDQARAGLLATVVARERLPATMRILRYERWLDLDGAAIERQVVELDSSAGASTSFNAVQSAIDFVDRGFRTGRDGRFTYFGPDADVLLDERFQRGYCFSIAESTPDRAAQVGLRFNPAGRRRDRVDIEGTLWIDTAQRVLRDIEFLYVGVDRISASFAIGGRIGFHALPSGVSFIDQWSLRLVGAADTIVGDVGTTTQDYAIREIGGEVASAVWPDSSAFVSSLATAHVTAVGTNGDPAAFTRLRFAGTDYRAQTDSLGRASIPFVLPGPYRVVVNDPRLDLVDVEIPTARPLTVQRASSALLRVVVPTAEQYVAPLCGRDTLLATDAWLLARVLGSDAEPAGGIHYRISEQRDGAWHTVSDRGVTPSTGLVALCRSLTPGADVEVAAWRRPNDEVRVRGRLGGKLTVLRVVVPERTVASRATDEAPTLMVAGVVMDTVQQRPVADARVTFLGTPYEAATDDQGRFVVGGIPRGVHLVEVSSPWYDSIGAVRRTTLSVRDTAPVTLYLPVLDDVMRATCGGDVRQVGDSVSDNVGAIVGRLRMRRGGTIPSGVRVLAEWTRGATIANPPAAPDSAPVQTRVQTDVAIGSGGTFRICGAPLDAPVTLRSISEGSVTVQDASREVRIAEGRRFVRADLELDSVVVSLPVLVGAVVADSTGLPVPNAEVTITDLGRTVRTDARGVFRLDSVPVGTHVLSVRQVGYSPVFASLDFAAGRIVEQRVQLTRATALSAVEVTADGVPAEFEERRRLGAGSHLARADLERHRGRRLGEVLSQVTGFGQAIGGGARSFVVGKRAPVRIPPREGQAGCGQGGQSGTCTFSTDGLRGQGYYCPTQAEQRQGILSCACFAQVYVDNVLMNNGRPTEPFDVSTVAVDEIAGVEFFPTPASTPSRYSMLNTVCGVMLIWTRR